MSICFRTHGSRPQLPKEAVYPASLVIRLKGHLLQFQELKLRKKIRCVVHGSSRLGKRIYRKRGSSWFASRLTKSIYATEHGHIRTHTLADLVSASPIDLNRPSPFHLIDPEWTANHEDESCLPCSSEGGTWSK